MSLTIKDINTSVKAGEEIEPLIKDIFMRWLQRRHSSRVYEETKYPEFSRLDYFIKEDGYGFCNLEVKARENKSDAYEETIIPVGKVYEARRQYEEDGILAFYIVYFIPDMRCGIWDLLPVRRRKSITRKDRDITEEYFLIPIKEALSFGKLSKPLEVNK